MYFRLLAPLTRCLIRIQGAIYFQINNCICLHQPALFRPTGRVHAVARVHEIARPLCHHRRTLCQQLGQLHPRIVHPHVHPRCLQDGRQEGQLVYFFLCAPVGNSLPMCRFDNARCFRLIHVNVSDGFVEECTVKYCN